MESISENSGINRLKTTDIHLVRRLSKGDHRAFEVIYTKFYRSILGYVSGFTRNRPHAEEITQDVFIKLWEKREQINCEMAFDSYLYRIARNHTLNILKRTQFEIKLKDKLSHQYPKASNSTDLEMQYHECSLLVDKAISMLPPKRQEIFKMSRLDYMQHEQIAEKLDISRNTIKSQIVKASKFIRQYFDVQYSVPPLSVNY